MKKHTSFFTCTSLPSQKGTHPIFTFPILFRKSFIALFVFFVSMIYSQSPVTLSTPGAGTWTVPCNVTSIKVQAWGAGGGGSARTFGGNSGSAGGGGGAYAENTILNVVPGQVFSFTVGMGGTGSPSATGKNGGDTLFDTTLKAEGGKGAIDISGLGFGSGGTATNSIGSNKRNGGNGGTSENDVFGNTRTGGGGGGAGFSTGNGGNGDNGGYGNFFEPRKGDGGTSTFPGGKGGNGGYENANGSAGVTFGGGGGGSQKNNGGSYNGGNGANGGIIITYSTVLPNPTVANSITSTLSSMGCGSAITETTLTTTGGTIGSGVSTLYYEGNTCPTFFYINEFFNIPTVSNTTVGALTNGNRRFTSTSNDPMIHMENVLSPATIDPIKYKYITVRYKVVSKLTAGNQFEIYFKKGILDLAEDKLVRTDPPLIEDGKWHILNIDMSTNVNWNNTGGNITGWRFDYATKSGTVMDIDYLILGDTPILENTNEDDSSIKVTPSLLKSSTVYGSVRTSECGSPFLGCTAGTQPVVTNLDRTFKDNTNWNLNSNWIQGLVPTLDNCVNIPTGKNVSINTPTAALAKSITVNANSTLTINANASLTLQNGLNNLGSATNVIVESDGNLIQTNDAAVNSGNITAQKVFTFVDGSVTANDRKQYNYVISPVIGQNLKTIYPGNPTTVYHTEANNFFYASDGSYILGRGLAIKEPAKTAVVGASTTANFVGIPFNGIVNYPLQYSTKQAAPANRGFNLVGNPYPSNLNIQDLYKNNSTKITASFYFWDNRGNVQYSQQGSTYNGDNYAKFNAASGTGVAIGTKASGASGAERKPTEFVKVGTAFMVQALPTANGKTLDFKNTLRTAGSGPAFFGKNTTQKDRFWLQLKTPADLLFMNAVVYFPEGSKDLGPEDTESFGSSDDIYTLVDDRKLAIQGRDDFQKTDRLNLGLSLFQTGNYEISIQQKEGVFANGQSIYLKDKQEGIITNLSEGSYTFNSSKGNNSTRFEIIYQPETVLATDSNTKEQLMVYKDGSDFVVKAQSKNITGLEVYDATGRLITQLQPNQTKVIIPAESLVNGVYILKINQNGVMSSKKIIK